MSIPILFIKLKNSFKIQKNYKININMKPFYKKILVLSLLILGPLLTQARFLEKYSDWRNTPPWAQQAFEALLHENIISGNDDKTLTSDRTINRAEFSKILVNATGKKFSKSLGNKFKDVRSGDWFYPYVEIAYAEGWIAGYPDGSFKPGNPINRAEIAKLLTKAFKFNLVKIEQPLFWYLPYVQTLNQYKLLPRQILTKNFSPARTPTRAEVFEQLYRSIRVYKGSVKKGDSQAPSVTTKVEKLTDPFAVEGNFTIKRAITPDGATIAMKKPDNLPREIPIQAGQKNVTPFHLELLAQKKDVLLPEIKFRRIGFGFLKEFQNVWLEIDGTPITKKFPTKNIKSDFLNFKFKNPIVLKKNVLKVLELKTDISTEFKADHSHRFLLYMPHWLNATTNEEIGYFPFGGSDIVIKKYESSNSDQEKISALRQKLLDKIKNK